MYIQIHSGTILLLQDDSAPHIIVLFTSPIAALWNVIVQTAGGIDAGIISGSSLLYPVLSYTLFIVFVIAMPILFNNFLVSLCNNATLYIL